MTRFTALSKLDDLALTAAVNLCNRLEGDPHNVAAALNAFALTSASGMQYLATGRLSGEDLATSGLLVGGAYVFDVSYAVLRSHRYTISDYAISNMVHSLNKTTSRLFAAGGVILSGLAPFADAPLYCATLAGMCASISAGRYCMRAIAER
jgi:hypothetical protein